MGVPVRRQKTVNNYMVRGLTHILPHGESVYVQEWLEDYRDSPLIEHYVGKDNELMRIEAEVPPDSKVYTRLVWTRDLESTSFNGYKNPVFWVTLPPEVRSYSYEIAVRRCREAFDKYWSHPEKVG